jgi:hypothetical protein
MRIEAKQRLTARYRGESGTYISVAPDSASADYISQFLQGDIDGRYAQPAELHATVVYSKVGLTREQQLAIAKLVGPETKFEATVSHLTAWKGHDGGVYLVMKFDCPALVELNRTLVTTFGLVGNFDEYRPHITLVSNIQGVEPLFTDVALRPRLITFTGLRIEDAK